MTEASLKKKWETPFKPQPPLYVQLLVDNRLWMFEANKPKIKHVRPHVIESFCMSLCVCGLEKRSAIAVVEAGGGRKI